ncbi:MAG TPA: RraA family protein, partial [Planctomycetaceae bacterium]|nr:RraA family protein [Planctomycetaceae bacterium]
MSQIPGLSPETLAALARFDTPTVCNAIELFEVRPRNTGFMNPSIKACFPAMPPMVGYAVTSTFRSMAPPRAGDVYASMTQQVESFGSLPGPAVMVYQDIDVPVVSATFGEVMCTVYKSFGAKGLITSGAGRDLEQVEKIGFPTFTSGAICAHGYCHTLAVNVPVTVGGICIYPGDLLHGDLNGVSTIPHEIASEVPQVCDELATAEKVILDYCRGKNINPAGFEEARKECVAMFGAITKRVSR